MTSQHNKILNDLHKKVINAKMQNGENNYSLVDRILKVERKTQRKNAILTIEIQDDLAEKLIEQTTNYFSHIPIRGLNLSWVYAEKETT
jgi:hypothetical protein